MKTHEEVRSEIAKEFTAIESLAHDVKTYQAMPREYDALARDIRTHADRIKDLSYLLHDEVRVPGLTEALDVETKLAAQNKKAVRS